MSSSRSIAAARSRRALEQQPPPPPPSQQNTQQRQTNVKQTTFAPDVQTKISVQDAINIVTRRISRLEQMSSSQQLQLPENSCVVDNEVLEDIVDRLSKLEEAQEQFFESIRREVDTKIEALSRDMNEKLADVDLAFAEIEKGMQEVSTSENKEISSGDVGESIQLEISNA